MKFEWKRWLLPVGAGVCTALAGAASPALAAPPLTVTVPSCTPATATGFVGNYPGGATGSMRQFLGIPYAAPPTGANRWQPPKTFCWSGNRLASNFGSSCPQGFSLDPWEKEDCLTLNVFTQPTGTVSNRPVMVYIHGGGLISGSGSYQANPVDLVNKGVVVTINYRIGALGFLAHAALDNVATKNTGNYGILDQQAALKWVKANINAFGGNPGNVTVFGQSAGGLSVLVNLVSPLSAGLFHKAIMESAASYATPPTLAAAEAQGASFASAVGCSTAACLRNRSVNTILANQGIIGQSTGLLRQDNVVLTDTIKNLLMTGQFAKVPIINGSTHDESRFHTNGNPSLGTGTNCSFVSNITPMNYVSKLSNFFGASANQVASQYSSGGSALTANIAFAQARTDRDFACRALRVSKWIAQKNGKVFGYEFNDQKAPPTLFPQFTIQGGAKFPYGAYHGAEGGYLFRMSGMNACGGAIPALTTSQKQLAAAMVTYWTTFAKTGNPNPAAAPKPPAWPVFAKTNANMMSLLAGTPKTMTASGFDTDHKCSSFWDGIAP